MMRKINIFYSYSHVDDKFRVRLEKFLIQLKKDNIIDEWHDRKITAGDIWNEEIKRKLKNADIVLLLISQDYLSSSACNEELEYALANLSCKTVVPIILKPSTWKDTKFSKIQALPRDGQPIVSWQNEDDAWLNVYDGIKELLNKKKELKINPEFISTLENIEFVSKNVGKIKLSEVFVWPEIRKFSTEGKDNDFESDFKKIIGNKNKYLVFKGTILSGRTSLCKKLFIELANSGRHPIWVDGDYIYKTRNFEEIIEEALRKQYLGDVSNYSKTVERTLLVDNYHSKISRDFIDRMKGCFDSIIVFIEEEEYLLYFKDEMSIADFDIFSINSMSLVKQEELIINWKKLGMENITDPLLFDRDVETLEDRINNIITRNQVVPRHPFYVLSILQAFEGFMPGDYQITAFGHCYQALITSQLIKKNVHPSEVGDAFNYLTELSYYIFKSKNHLNSINAEEFQKFKKNYSDEYIIKDSLLARIEDQEYPIIKKNALIRFEHPFIYYYFIGKNLAEKPNDKVIAELCADIYKKNCSNILIFTIHHSQNQKILDEIQLHCMCSFDSFKSSKLDVSETSFMDDLLDTIPKSLLSQKSIAENRRIEREKQTQDLKTTKDTEEDIKDETQISVNRAMKIVEVLGQILKNRAGSFPKKKIQELTIEIEELGLRVLSYMLNTLKSQEIKDWLLKRLNIEEQKWVSEKKNFDSEIKKKFIERNIQFISLITTIGMLNKIYYSVNTEKLISIQEDISASKNVPSYDFINLQFKLSFDLIDILDIRHLHKKYFDSKNRWALKAMSLYLQRYINTHAIDYKLKQQICDLLEIKLPQKFLH